jgi:hypothetical protein
LIQPTLVDVNVNHEQLREREREPGGEADRNEKPGELVLDRVGGEGRTSTFSGVTIGHQLV